MQTNMDKNSLKEKTIIVMMIISAFAGIYYAICSWLELSDKDWRTNLTEERIIQTENFVTESDSSYFITGKILPLLKYICENPKEDIEELRKSYLDSYDLDLSIYRFTPENKLESTAPPKAPNIWLMRNMFPLLTEKDVEKINSNKKELDKKIEFAFGHGKDLVSIKNNPEIVVKTVCSGKECFFAWSHRPTGGVLIYGNRLPDKDKVFKQAASKINNPNVIYANCFPDVITTNEAIEAAAADLYFNKNSITNGIYGDKEWYFASNKNNEKYYIAYKITNSIYKRGISYLRFLFIILIPLFLIIISKISQATILSLKKMVILIFLASSILPLSGICSISQENLDAFANIYKSELKSTMEEAIDNIIQHFNNYLSQCTKRLMALTDTQNGQYDFKKMEKDVSEEFINTRFELRDAASVPIYCNGPAFSPGQEEIVKAICHVYIKDYMPSRLTEAQYKGNPFADVMVKKDDMGFCWLTKNPNKLIFINNGGARMFMFIRLLPQEAGKAALIDIQPDLENTMKDYVKSIDPRTLISKQQQISFSSFNPLKFRWQIPPKLPEKSILEQAKAAHVIGKPIYRKVVFNNESYYTLCIPNSDIDAICYLGSLSIEDLQKKIKTQKLYITISAIIAFLLLIAIISWLMKQLIAPLSNLETGIQALAQRKFETKLPVPNGNDELVQLFKEFNFMMGESYDMQIAKNVQEGLITQKFPQTDNYYISGISATSDNLGGDCLTSFALPNGKILFLVGDLTGHSIGSALMMAFVRAVTFNWSQQSNDDPSTLVEDLDNLLRENKMKHMSIGIICGILNPENGIIKYITNGHIYPLFIRNNGSAEWLGTPAFPLGVGKKLKTTVIETQLQPGERMLCITSGLIEINMNGGITTGFETIQEWAKQTKSEAAENWISAIQAKFAEWCQERNVVPTDDTTIFTIISKGAAK